MAGFCKGKPLHTFVRTTSMAFLLLLGIEARANEVLLAQMSRPGQIEVEVRERLDDSLDQPVIHLFEVVKIGDTERIFERNPTITRRLVGGHLAATLELVDPPSANFDHFEVEVRNYKSDTDSRPQTFRGPVVGIRVTIARARNRSVDLHFRGPNSVDWERFKRWITTAAAPAAVVTITRSDSSTVEAREPRVSNLLQLPDGNNTRVSVRFNLDQSLPPESTVTLTFEPRAFPPNPTAVGLPLDLLKVPVGPFNVAGDALGAGQDRDEARLNVLEVGGNLNTSIKLDPDPATNEEPERETEATFDLRLATSTMTLKDHNSRYTTWTPAQLDVQVSNGKLTGDSISTNTIRAFTQIQQVFNSTGSGPISFYRLVGEGGINADRDLRTIEYTGLGDFRWSPGVLNRVFGENPAGRETRIRAEFIPIGVELGHRQVRRDPLFEADDFIRRLRFGAKFEFVKAPYFEFSIEDRMWWRGEFAQNKFKNFFTTTFTYLPVSGEANSSFGIFFSYERGALPPFTVQRTSTLKMGFRVRRKKWGPN